MKNFYFNTRTKEITTSKAIVDIWELYGDTVKFYHDFSELTDEI